MCRPPGHCCGHPPRARDAHGTTCAPYGPSLSPAPQGEDERGGLPPCPAHTHFPPLQVTGPAAPRAPPRTGASQKPRGIERGALRSPVPTLPGDPVRSWGAPAKLEERWLRLWDDGRCRGGSSPRMGSAGLGRARGKGGTSGGPWAVFGEGSDRPSQARESVPRGLQEMYAPRERQAKAANFSLHNNKIPPIRKARRVWGPRGSASPLRPVETVASQAGRGWMHAAHFLRRESPSRGKRPGHSGAPARRVTCLGLGPTVRQTFSPGDGPWQPICSARSFSFRDVPRRVLSHPLVPRCRHRPYQNRSLTAGSGRRSLRLHSASDPSST